MLPIQRNGLHSIQWFFLSLTLCPPPFANCISRKFLEPSPLGFISPFSCLLGAREFLREMDHFMVWLPHPLLIHAEFETLSAVAASSIARSLAYARSQSALEFNIASV
jgi:hypothetical protein